jgi:hypothetical protein
LSATFRQIEAAWADSLLAQANASTEPAQKRGLLDQIARSTNVDSLRRNRAANDLAALNAGSVDVSDLPSASEPKPAGTAAHSAVASAGARPATPPEQPSAPEQPKPKAPTAAPPVPGKANAPATLVRKNPFD